VGMIKNFSILNKKSMNYKLTINIPEDAFSVLKKNPDEFAKELLLAALSK